MTDAKGFKSKKVLILDDEPEFMMWVTDFLETLSLSSVSYKTVDEGLSALTNEEYRLFIVDMNIPASESLIESSLSRMPLARRYPGMIFAQEVRNRGYGPHSVIAYTVHDDALIAAELNKMHCRYVLKGRPSILKSVINQSIQPLPKSAR